MKHGMRSTYVKGCRCDQCRAANCRYAKLAKYRQDTGRKVLVDAEPVKRHLVKLRAAGVGKRTIAQRSGVAQTVVNRLIGIDHSKPARRIRPETARKLLAVTVEDHADGAYIDSIGTTRRLQALVALGYSQTSLAARLGWTTANLNVITLGNRSQVTRATAQLIAALYDELSMTPGTSARARSVAARRGWLPPLAWDDDTIDSPHVQAPGARRTTSKVQCTAEDVHELLAMGETLDGIAARFAIRRNTVEQIIFRASKAAS